jgi:hypothetical protein
MTEDNLHNSTVETDPDETLVAPPRFDDVATETARPVVPLTPDAARVAASESSFKPYYILTRRSWLIALVVASAFIGSVLGGVGLRLYQQHRRAVAQTVKPEHSSAQESEAALTSPTTTDADQTASAPQEAPDDGVADVTDATYETKEQAPVVEELDTVAPAPRDEDEDADSDGDEREKKKSKSAIEARRSSDDEEKDAARDDRKKKGKRGDVEDQRAEREARRRESDRQARAERRAAIEREDTPRAERVADIIQDRRPRRSPPRQETTRDRVRAIFEGQPPD